MYDPTRDEIAAMGSEELERYVWEVAVPSIRATKDEPRYDQFDWLPPHVSSAIEILPE